ncbi:MAG: hypothetical protein ACRC6D_07420 [Aeromonas sp.]
MFIGSFRREINTSQEYLSLARADEKAAEELNQASFHRQACYFIIQSMEKYIRSMIFSLVNSKLDFFRDENRNHSLDSAVEFLVKIISSDQIIQQQVLKQLSEHVLGGIKYNYLHNNLRYPNYSRKSNSYSMLEVEKKDYQQLSERLLALKNFLNDIEKLR